MAPGRGDDNYDDDAACNAPQREDDNSCPKEKVMGRERASRVDKNVLTMRYWERLLKGKTVLGGME